MVLPRQSLRPGDHSEKWSRLRSHGKPCGKPALEARAPAAAPALDRPTRWPSRPGVKDHAKSLEDTLEGQRAEQWVRLIFLALAGVPALWGAWAALRVLWRLRG